MWILCYLAESDTCRAGQAAAARPARGGGAAGPDVATEPKPYAPPGTPVAALCVGRTPPPPGYGAVTRPLRGAGCGCRYRLHFVGFNRNSDRWGGERARRRN